MIGELFKYNCSTLFILKPVVGSGYTHLEEEFGFINSFLRDKAREDLNGDLLFVLFKPSDFDTFEEFLQQQISNNRNVVEDYDYKGGYVVIVYRISEDLKPDFELFKQGKYSKISNILKNCYDKKLKQFLKPVPTFQWRVFDGDAKLRKELEELLEVELEKGMELWQMPDIEGKEVLDIDSIIKQDANEVLAEKINGL